MKMNKFLQIMFLLFLITKNSYATEKLDTLETKFHDVLLVVHYNHPHYKSMDFIREIYSPIFPNIVFYGEAAYPTVNVVKTEIGHYFTPVVEAVFKTFPGYHGYIFLQDDCLMNFWNYLRLDKEKIWFLATGSTKNFPGTSFDEQKPCWQFASYWGLKALRVAFPQLSTQDLEQYTKNHGENRAIGGMCDMFYIPGKFADQVIPLCEIFQNVFCEISIATILSCLDDTYNWELLSKLWSQNCEHSISNYNPSFDWIHPLKFSNEKYQEFTKTQIKKYYFNNN
jgi:hypothetical protein